ncbi:hypothetical protein BHE74_00017262 [Ensete ventricosum]|nr:hypothetical protein BHE74_00017262 [Ensete ventricosum]RZR85348.1 hypothetical protein BHM03_00012310 [Ensete ventricosum]
MGVEGDGRQQLLCSGLELGTTPWTRVSIAGGSQMSPEERRKRVGLFAFTFQKHGATNMASFSRKMKQIPELSWSRRRRLELGGFWHLPVFSPSWPKTSPGKANPSEGEGGFSIDLNMDVLRNIVSRLSHKDYVRCTAVCRSWRSVPPPPRPGARSMRLFVLPDNGECRIIDPSRNAVIYVDFPELAGVDVLSSKAGWLLLRRKDLSLFFFFRPSTRTRINLPPTNQVHSPQNYTAAFSAAPTDPDCVAVILNCLVGLLEVLTWRPGDERWTVHIFAGPFVFTGVYDLFACGHIFYCQGYDLKVCVFNPREITLRAAEVMRDFTYTDCETYLTEFEGELHVVFIGGSCTRVLVHRVDSSLTLKEEVRSLEDRTIYVGRWRADMVRSTEGQVMNKVYFPTNLTRSDKYLHYFSMKTERYYPNLPLNMRKKLHTMWGDTTERRVWIEADKSMLDLEESMMSSTRQRI